MHNAAIGLALVLAASCQAGTILVPVDQPTIQDALSVAEAGDVISIAAGTYQESDLYILDSDITIIGAVNDDGLPAVTIDGGGALTIILAIGVVGASDATVENITFTNAGGNAVWIYTYSPTIRNCTFTGNDAGQQGNSIWMSRSNALIDSCRFIDNAGGDNGIQVFSKGVTELHGDTGGTGPVFRSCVFEDNTGYATVASQFWSAQFDQCTFWNNGVTTTLYVHFGSESGTVTVTDSLFCQNDGTSITGPWTDGGDNQFLETCPPDCNGDINHDGQVNVSDLLAVISGWDNPYNVDDLLIVIANWGNCL